MWRLGNVTPLISVEGTEIVSDERRGRAGVLSKTLQGLHNALDAGVFEPRCPVGRGRDICKGERPPLVAHAERHWAACHFPGEMAVAGAEDRALLDD